jgi:hypothetical protein
VTVKVNAVVYFRVLNPEDAVVKVLDYHHDRCRAADHVSARPLWGMLAFDSSR